MRVYARIASVLYVVISAGGSSKGKSLADDPSFARPKYAESIEVDPRCERDANWSIFRLEVAQLRGEDAGALAMSFLFDDVLAGATTLETLDDVSETCFMGVVAALFLSARHRFDVDHIVDGAAYFFKLLDQYIASIHPDQLDAAAGNGSWWPVTDELMGVLRREVLAASANSTKGTAIRPTAGRAPGNAFQALPEDEVELGITLASSFRVYVYDVKEYEDLLFLARGASFCRDNQWGFEVALHDWFLACPCRTDNPEEADFYFVPHYTACHLNVGTFSEAESQERFESLVGSLKYFSRTAGSDHLFVWGSGMGVDGPFRSWRSFIPQSIFLMTETELWNPFSDISVPSYTPWKDIVLPGRLSLRDIESSWVAAGTPPSHRRFLAEFVGWHRPLHAAQGTADSPRKAILRWAADGGGEKDRRDLESYELFVKQDVPYVEALRGSTSSRFCLVPRGKSAWSSRFFRALFAGCVPVLLNDEYEAPFEAFLDVPRWLIKWPMRKVDDGLLNYLRALPTGTLDSMLHVVETDRCWYVYPPSALDSEQTDLMQGKLDPICPNWRLRNAFFGVMRLLLRKRRKSKTSFQTFYLPVDPSGSVRYIDESFRPVFD